MNIHATHGSGVTCAECDPAEQLRTFLASWERPQDFDFKVKFGLARAAIEGIVRLTAERDEARLFAEMNANLSAGHCRRMHTAEEERDAAREDARALADALRVVGDHIEELREAWERGVMREGDGMSGTRSNRNFDMLIKINRVLAEYDKAAHGVRKA